MVKKEFSNVERRTAHGEQRGDNVVRKGYLLRDIRFGIRFLVKNVVSFSFTLDWFLFLHLFSSTGKKKA